jgi:histidine triad (HIT) family protein
MNPAWGGVGTSPSGAAPIEGVRRETFIWCAVDQSHMSEDCIFCQIIAGDVPSFTVYEDEHVKAFLDANPLSKGHTLVIPKEHHERLADLPPEEAAPFYEALHRLVPAVQEAVDAPGCNVGINDGAAAGQEVPHSHYHIVPRYEGDGGGAMHSIIRTLPELEDDELEAIATDIADEV